MIGRRRGCVAVVWCVRCGGGREEGGGRRWAGGGVGWKCRQEGRKKEGGREVGVREGRGVQAGSVWWCRQVCSGGGGGRRWQVVR